MKVFERICFALILLGIIFKLALFPGGGILLTAGFTMLSLFYFFFGFAFFSEIGFWGMLKSTSYHELSPLRIFGFIAAGWSLSWLCFGILFKIQFWPGFEFNMIIALVSSVLIVVILLLKLLRRKHKSHKPLLARLAIIGTFGLMMFLLSPLDIERIIYRNHPAYLEAFENYWKDPDNRKLRDKMEIELLKTTMTDEEVEQYLQYYGKP